MTKPCTQCGRCCTNAEFMERFSVSDTDLERWMSEGRNDILKKVGKPSGWVTPGPCPFAARLPNNRYSCSIYPTRPLVCRSYPAAIAHMKFVDCEMLEPGDTDSSVAQFLQKRMDDQAA